jgi:glutaredoxin 3
MFLWRARMDSSFYYYLGAALLLTTGSAFIYKRSFIPFPTLTELQSSTEELQKLISESKVLVLSKTYCPYCKRTKNLLDELIQEKSYLTIVELDLMKDGSTLQSAAFQLTGQSTVPNVFIGGNHIGGNDRVQELYRNGRLLSLLKAAGAV